MSLQVSHSAPTLLTLLSPHCSAPSPLVTQQGQVPSLPASFSPAFFLTCWLLGALGKVPVHPCWSLSPSLLPKPASGVKAAWGTAPLGE